jgi:hypothetical protein
MIMKEFLMVILAGCLLLSLSSCLEDEEPKIDPCNDYEWAKVDQDGNEICFENASVSIFAPNTTHSYLLYMHSFIKLGIKTSHPFLHFSRFQSQV